MDRIKIIHLDDHTIFSEGLYKALKPNLGRSYYLRFCNSEDALTYMINSIRANEMPNLLITDFSHPGLNGFEFASRIRREERKWKRSPVPVFLLTMYSKSERQIKMGLLLRTFNFYLQKNAQGEEILQVIKSVC